MLACSDTPFESKVKMLQARSPFKCSFSFCGAKEARKVSEKHGVAVQGERLWYDTFQSPLKLGRIYLHPIDKAFAPTYKIARVRQ